MKKLIFVLLALASTFAFSQTTVAPFVNPKVQFFNGAAPCSGCLLSTFAAGQSTPLATYSESTGTTPNANPVVLDANGMASIYLTSASYKFVLKTAANVTIWTQDGVSWLTPLTTFPQGSVAGNFDITQPTAAINGANQSSFSSCIHGTFFNVASLDDKWCFQNVIGTGTSPTSTLTLTHSGSSGAATFSIPGNVSVGGTLGVTGASTEKILNNSILFADQYCTTPGLLDQTCIQNALTAIGNLSGPNFIAGAEIVLKAGQTFSINSCTTDAKGTYGILVDQKSGLTISGDGARILLNVNNNSCRTIEVRSSSHVVIKGVTLASANSLIGTAVSYRRPSNADAGTATVDNLLKNVKINPANVAGSAFNIGLEMGVAGEGQVSENNVENVEIYNANTAIVQDGAATETIVYEHVTATAATNGIIWDLRVASCTLFSPVTGNGTNTGVIHYKFSGQMRNVVMINPHTEIAQNSGLDTTTRAMLWTATNSLQVNVYGGVMSDFRSATNGFINLNNAGASGTLTFFGTNLFRGSGSATIDFLASAGVNVERFEGIWTNIGNTNLSGDFSRFSGVTQPTITAYRSFGFDSNATISGTGTSNGSIQVSIPPTYGGTPAQKFVFGNGFFQTVGGSTVQPDSDNSGEIGNSGGNTYYAKVNAYVHNVKGAIVAVGSAATLSGTGACATITTQVGGAWAGSAKCTGTTGAATLTVSINVTAPNGWICSVSDETTRANLFQQTTHAATSCTLTATSVTQNDVFVFSAIAF